MAIKITSSTYEAPPQLSLPSARPYSYEFPLASTALVIIDIQRDFVDPGGFGSVQCGNDELFSQARSIVPAVRKVLDKFRAFNGHVIHTREGHQSDLADLPASKRLRQISAPNGHHQLGIGDQGPMGRLLVRGEYGHDIVDELTPIPGEAVIDKPGKGSFWGTSLHRELLSRGITHLLFAGVTTECCVTTTLRECNDRGFQCCVLEDCTTGFDPTQVTVALDTVCGQDGLFGFVGNSAEFLAATRKLPSPKPQSDALLLGGTGKLPSIDELVILYQSGAISPSDVITSVYDRINKYQQEDPAVWIYKRPREETLEAAEQLAAKYANKALPPLFGIPFSVKDNIDVAKVETTQVCSKFAYTPQCNAPAVQYLLDNGAIFIGKVNLDQLATGLNGTRSPYGIPHSVFSKDHISGGSSSGSAVSVAAGLVSFSLGTDTAGSTRVPAGFNGIVGHKPTIGTISARGMAPACQTLDTVTVMAPTVFESRKVWSLIAHYDAEDPFAKHPRSLPTWKTDYRGYRQGGFTFTIPPASALEVCSPEFRQLFETAVQKLQACGGSKAQSRHGASYSDLDRAGKLLYEGSLLYERITCIGLENIQENIEYLHPATKQVFSEALSKPRAAYEVFADQALRVRITRDAQRMFDTLDGGVDVLVVPTTPSHPTIDAIQEDPLRQNSLLGTFTHFANVVDLCAVTVPAGSYVTETGIKLPFSITILGGSGMDAKVLDIAQIFEQA
ncbi:Allophanate hydrolase [Paramyrothecium foliicola]|nr:Allophanate hydrolase [Paramyrothecium foliicola]